MTVKAKRIMLLLSCAIIVLSLALMALPTGTSLTFAPGPNETRVVTYSYFNVLMLFGYAHFFPLLTVAAAIIWLCLSLWKLVRDKHVQRRSPLVAFAINTSLFSVLSFISTTSPTALGYVISGTIVAAAILQILAYKKGAV